MSALVLLGALWLANCASCSGAGVRQCEWWTPGLRRSLRPSTPRRGGRGTWPPRAGRCGVGAAAAGPGVLL